jgi:hypothetical protein
MKRTKELEKHYPQEEYNNLHFKNKKRGVDLKLLLLF